MYRWIMYVSQNIPCNVSFDLHRVRSLAEAREKFTQFCDAVMSDNCTGTLYWYTDDAWSEAEDFRDIGCPFDYPDRIIERGPRNGVLVQNT